MLKNPKPSPVPSEPRYLQRFVRPALEISVFFTDKNNERKEVRCVSRMAAAAVFWGARQRGGFDFNVFDPDVRTGARPNSELRDAAPNTSTNTDHAQES